MLSPIIIFVYNRADHFQQTFEALSRCQEAKDSDLFIFSDGAKNERAVPQVHEVRKAVHAIENTPLFKSVTIYEAPENRGLASSIIAGVTEVISRYGRVVVVEDDCLASPYFLSFMNRALDAFEKNSQLGSISGYAPQIDFPDNYISDTFLAWRSCSMSWATWADRWQDIDWNLKNISDFYRNPELLKRLNANGNDRFIRLYRQTKGNGSSWSVRFGAHLVKNGYYTLYPRYSYIQNIGCDATGVHSRVEDEVAVHVDISKAISMPSLELPEFSQEIQKKMKLFYSGGFLSSVKRAFATQFIVLTKRLGF